MKEIAYLTEQTDITHRVIDEIIDQITDTIIDTVTVTTIIVHLRVIHTTERQVSMCIVVHHMIVIMMVQTTIITQEDSLYSKSPIILSISASADSSSAGAFSI